MASDSLSRHVTRVLTREGVRADTAQLSIPLSRLPWLDGGTRLTARSGRATVSARLDRRSGEQVMIVEGDCDSLERECMYYSEETERLKTAMSRMQANERTEARQRNESTWLRMQLCLAGALAGLAVGILITLIIKKKWQTVF